ncbi:conserved hypothetical protein [Clostridium botulinum C str. Eklund]|nr:conserved hypothetical protein [Clostridium botulinum C str. Eklund]
MQMIEILKLQPHPRNQEFFDDIPKERWDDFIKSIVRRGVVEAIVVTQDLLIVSGHQRVKACKEIGILEIPCRITHYPDEDEKLHISKEDMILEDLICTNIMQRGVGNVNPMKMARCIRELERIYGVKKGGNGSNQYTNKELNGNNFVEAPNKTQDDLAKQIGIDQRQLQNYKKLNELIPELQSLVETGALKSTTAYKIWAKMPQDEQEKFFNDIGQEKIKQLTQKKTEQIISEKKQLEDENKELQKCFNELSNKYNALENIKNKVEGLKKQLEEKPKEIIKEVTIEKEIVPDDYIDLKNKIKKKDEYYNNLKKEYDSKVKQMFNLEDEIRSIKEKSESENYTKKLQDSALTFCTRVHSFIETSSGLAWLAEHINELPPYEKKSYIKAVRLMEDWVLAVKSNMKQYV